MLTQKASVSSKDLVFRKRLFYGIGFAGVTVCVVLVVLAVTLAIVLTDGGGSET